jgi:hypothetical protein
VGCRDNRLRCQIITIQLVIFPLRVYGWEGFDPPDLKEAKALDALAS